LGPPLVDQEYSPISHSMRLFHPSPSPLQMLAVRWRVFGAMLIALARLVSMSHKQGAHGGARRAEMIEMRIYSALVELSSEISTHSSQNLNRSDKDALTYLKTAHALLGVIALLVRQLRMELQAAAETHVKLCGFAKESGDTNRQKPIEVYGYLDSS